LKPFLESHHSIVGQRLFSCCEKTSLRTNEPPDIMAWSPIWINWWIAAKPPITAIYQQWHDLLKQHRLQLWWLSPIWQSCAICAVAMIKQLFPRVVWPDDCTSINGNAFSNRTIITIAKTLLHQNLRHSRDNCTWKNTALSYSCAFHYCNIRSYPSTISNNYIIMDCRKRLNDNIFGDFRARMNIC
jgi:hypothetical protein